MLRPSPTVGAAPPRPDTSGLRRRPLGVALLAAGVLLPVAATLASHLAARDPVGPGQLVAPLDAADPDVVVAGPDVPPASVGYPPGTAVVFATQGFWSPPGGGIQRFTVPLARGRWSATSPAGVDVALAVSGTPSWVDRSRFLQAPGVYFYAGRWVLFYAAHHRQGLDAATVPAWDFCIGVATSPRLAGTFVPAAPDAPPLLCQDGGPLSTFDRGSQDAGVIDPSPFVDPRTGLPYLLFKTGNRIGGPPARLWSVPLDPATGTTLAPGAAPRVVLAQQAGTSDTIENPDLVAQAGTYVLYYATGSFSARYQLGTPAPPIGSQVPVADPVSYGETFARCDGPMGPCHPSGTALLATDDAAGRWGPGGGSVFFDGAGTRFIAYGQWSSRCASYVYCPPGTPYPSPRPYRATWFAPLADVARAEPDAGLLAAGIAGVALAAAGAALLVSDIRRARAPGRGPPAAPAQ